MIGFLTSKLGMAVIGALLFAGYTGFVWVKATSYANAQWSVKVAAATENVRQEQAARNRRNIEELRALVDIRTKEREKVEQEKQEALNALAADKTDATVDVSPELDKLLCRPFGGRGTGGPCTDTGG